jgi:short-subunit dehydrogenase
MGRGFQGKRIWIIGASAGIGAALARELHARGAQLILSARDAGALQALAADCGDAQVLPLDLAQTGSLTAAVDMLMQGDRLDSVICTAAQYDPGRVADMDPDRTETLVRVNLLASLEIARLVPPLIANGGQLVLFGSVAGYLGLPNGQPYSATKAAIINLAESLRIELAPKVDVRLVCPGFVQTRLTDKNDFPMPAIITPEQAAVAVADGLQGKQFEIHFPKRFTLPIKLLRALPYGLSLRLTRRLG